MRSTALIAAALVFLCGPMAFASDFEPYAFFKNSNRRDANQTEKQTVVHLEMGCTAFFVKNSQNRTLLITARHCAKLAITNWCQNKGSFTDDKGRVGTCTGVVAADVDRDIALIEGKLSYTPSQDQGLELASFSPAVGDNLVMIGFPADKYRSAKLTVTENCWITDADLQSPWHYSTKMPLKDRSSTHNCTTYGGNSGGPMILEGTRVALGLPFTYYPNNYFEYEPHERNAYMAQMEDFVAAHRQTLLDAGVVIANAPPPPGP